MRNRGKRHHLSARRMHVHRLQRGGTGLILRINFHHHVVLIQLPVNSRNLALAKAVVQCVVDILWRDAKSRCSIAVDDYFGIQAAVLLVGIHVPQFPQRAQFLQQFRSPRA